MVTDINSFKLYVLQDSYYHLSFHRLNNIPTIYCAIFKTAIGFINTNSRFFLSPIFVFMCIWDLIKRCNKTILMLPFVQRFKSHIQQFLIWTLSFTNFQILQYLTEFV